MSFVCECVRAHGTSIFGFSIKCIVWIKIRRKHTRTLAHSHNANEFGQEYFDLSSIRTMGAQEIFRNAVFASCYCFGFSVIHFLSGFSLICTSCSRKAILHVRFHSLGACMTIIHFAVSDDVTVRHSTLSHAALIRTHTHTKAQHFPFSSNSSRLSVQVRAREFEAFAKCK